MRQKSVLLIGIDPTLLDLSRAPGVTAQQIKATGDTVTERLRSMGYLVQNCPVDLGETAERTVLAALTQQPADCVMIGAGIRAMLEHTLLFEKIINAVHTHAPTAKLCFNTNPANTVEAVLRWIDSA